MKTKCSLFAKKEHHCTLVFPFLSIRDLNVLFLFFSSVSIMVAKKDSTYARVASVDATLQTHKAYQRQTNVNENNRNPSKKNVNRSGKIRYWKSAGLGFKIPKEAINGKYIDKKCPFTGDVSIRGRLIRGIVKSCKMQRSIVISRNYLHFIQKYQRYQKRHKNFTVHCSPAFEPKVGDDVIVGQCRPLSKTVRYNVLEVIKKSSEKLGKKFSRTKTKSHKQFFSCF